MLVSYKADFKAQKITKDREGHYILIKGSIQQQHIILILSVYASNNRTSKYMKQKKNPKQYIILTESS